MQTQLSLHISFAGGLSGSSATYGFKHFDGRTMVLYMYMKVVSRQGIKNIDFFPGFSTCIGSFTLFAPEATQTGQTVKATYKQAFPYLKTYHKMFVLKNEYSRYSEITMHANKMQKQQTQTAKILRLMKSAKTFSQITELSCTSIEI